MHEGPGTASIAVLEEGTPADEAGLREGDVLFLVDKREPESFGDLKVMLRQTDDERSGHAFVVWRPKAGAPRAGRRFDGSFSQWMAGHEIVEVRVRPIVR